MKKWILVALVIGIVTGIAVAQMVNKYNYYRALSVTVSNPDNLKLVKNPTTVTGGDYVLVLNASSVSGGTTVFNDTVPVEAGDMDLNIILQARQK